MAKFGAEPIRNFADAQARNKQAGDTWFSANSMKAFKCRVEVPFLPDPEQERTYFVTSEEYTSITGLPGPRRFTVRSISWTTGRVATEGLFQAYGSAAQALAVIRTTLIGSGPTFGVVTPLRPKTSRKKLFSQKAKANQKEA